MKPKNIRAGFSLVELAVAMSILGLVLAIPILLLRSAEQLQRTRTAQAELEGLARRTLDRIAERLEASGTAVIPQWGGGPGVGTSLVEFQPAIGWAAGATVWGPLERIQLADDPADPDDGVDNDSDGTIDEKRVLWITDVGLPTQRTLVLCGSVRDSLAGELPANGLDDNGNGLIDEAGLVFAFDADSVTVRITLEKRDGSGQVISHTAQRNIAFRN
ncbi:MAG TPA: prepilin-type N-terminal cleavage/methylation domain-containing protein [Planctomycetota bacterium]|nr:prepilin-type N-terminal cleavage/methylation domain-containing protein [Planctomycetota bacterium]